MRKNRLFVMLAAGVLGAAALIYVVGSNEDDPTWRLARVEAGPIVSTVSAAGSVELRNVVPVVTQVGGEVLEVPAEFNEEVKAGDVLARIDDAAAAARLKMAQAQLQVVRGGVDIARSEVELARRHLATTEAASESARASVGASQLALSDADRTYSVSRKLAATGDAAAVEAERAMLQRSQAASQLAAAKAQQTSAEAAVAAAKAQLEVAEVRLANAQEAVSSEEIAVQEAAKQVEYAVIRAPVDGVVMAKSLKPRQQVGPGAPAFTVAGDNRQIEVHARVDEADIGRIAVGQSAVFSFGAFPGKQFQGTVTEIRRMPQVAEGVVTYIAVIESANEERALLSGMTAEILIVVGNRESAIKVPKSALRFVPPAGAGGGGAQAAVPASAGGGAVVWRPSGNGHAEPVPVRTGISDGAYTEIVEGPLKPGDPLIVGLAAGDPENRGSLRF